MRKYGKWLIITAICSQFGNAWATDIGVRPATTSDDYSGLNNNLTTFGGGWLSGLDSTYSPASVGMSGSYGFTHATTFKNVTIPQGSTVSVVEWWVKSGCFGCTDSAILRATAYNADNGVQIVDTAGFRTAWASRYTTTIDTGYLATTTSWTTAGVYYKLPLNNLATIVNAIVNRAGWTSGNSLTMFCVPAAISPANNRGVRGLDYSASTYDSLFITYTAGGGGSPSATPNVVIRTATLHTTTLRSPEKLFRREETWKW